MRTTITLENDAFQAAKAKAAHENISLGQAISSLIMQAISEQPTGPENSAVFRSNGGLYTSQQVEEALQDE